MDAIASRLEAITIVWRPSELGWRPSLLGSIASKGGDVIYTVLYPVKVARLPSR